MKNMTSKFKQNWTVKTQDLFNFGKIKYWTDAFDILFL